MFFYNGFILLYRFHLDLGFVHNTLVIFRIDALILQKACEILFININFMLIMLTGKYQLEVNILIFHSTIVIHVLSKFMLIHHLTLFRYFINLNIYIYFHMKI